MHTWSWQLLRAGRFRLDGGGMFGVVPKPLWSRMTTPDDENRIALDTNCLLLQDGETTVLVETGFGDKWSRKERGFYDLAHRTVVDALREVGVDPAAIDHVIVTHLHFDHAGGLTHGNDADEPVCSFPNALIHVQRTEWEDALSNKAVMTRTYLRSHLDPVAEQIALAEGESEILPGLLVSPIPGHTWGQQAIRFDDGEGVVCFPGDVMPTRNHVGAAFNMGYDILPYRNVQSKRDLLSRAAAEGWRLVLDHEPNDPIVHVEPDPEKREWFVLR